MTEQTAAPYGRLLYGCMGLGGDWSNEPHEITDVEAAAEAIDAALDIGVTLFDHADIYRHGKSEAVFGEVLAGTSGLRERIQLQTKCGIRLNERGLETHYDLSASNMSAAQIEFLQDSLETPVVANQLELSLLKRDWLESTVLVNHPDAHSYSFPHGTLEYCARQGITLQAYGALARGHYTGNPPERPTPAEGATAALLAEMAREKDTTMEAVLLGWLMKHPAGIAPVIGSANPDRIRSCAGAARAAQTMTRAEWYRLWITARGSNIP